MEKELHKLKLRQEEFVERKIFGYFYEKPQVFIELQEYKRFLGENRLSGLIFDTIWEKERDILNNIYYYLLGEIIENNRLLKYDSQAKLNYERIVIEMYDYYFRTEIGWKKFVKRYNKWLARKSKGNENE